MKKLPFLLMASFAFLYSCSKDDSAPGNTDEPSVLLHKEITAKWQLDPDMVESLLPRNEVPTPQGRPIDMNEADPAPNTSFVEFLSDSTYIVGHRGAVVLSGTFSAKSGDSIVLSNAGSLGGIKLNGNKLEGRFHFDLASQTIEISAPKFATIATDERTKLLCRNWKVAREENFAVILDETGGEPIDSANIYITNSGTFLVRNFYQGEPVNSEVYEWKWHATATSTILFWDYEGIDGAIEWTIRENTSSVLKVTEWIDFEGDSADDEAKFTLRPVK